MFIRYSTISPITDILPRYDKLIKLAATLWWFTAAPKPLKIQVFGGSPSPQGSYGPYILRDTTRPGHATCVLVWSKSDQRRLRKTLHKQTDRQTDTTKIMVSWLWTNKSQWIKLLFHSLYLSTNASVSSRHCCQSAFICHAIQDQPNLLPS